MQEIKINQINKNIELVLHQNTKSFDGVFLVVPDILDNHTHYKDFANFLNKNNYLCAVLNIHKNTDEQDKKNIFDAFKENINSILGAVKYLEDEFKTKEVVLVGHGFGSYLITRFLEISGTKFKAILTGSGYKYLPHLKYIKLPVLLSQAFRFRPHKGDLIKNLIFKNLEKGFENGNWISTDAEFFDEFVNNENYKNIYEFNFYYSFLSNILVKDKNIKNINNNTKILLLWGEDDPLLKSKDVVLNTLDKFNSNNISANYKTFAGMLHNIFNEVEKEKVFGTILSFVKQ